MNVRDRVSTGRYVATVLGLSLIFTGYVGESHGAEQPVLKIELGGWSAEPSYRLSTGQSGRLNDGSAFSSEFREVLALHPDALREAESANTARSMILLGNVVMIAGSLIMLGDTMNQADNLEQEPDYGRSLGLVLVGAVISMTAGSSYRNRLNNAVDIFNREEARNPKLGAVGHHEYQVVVASRSRAGLSLGLDINDSMPAEVPGRRGGLALIGMLEYRF